MTLRLQAEHHFGFLSLKGGCTGSYESTLIKMPYCWKSHVTAHAGVTGNVLHWSKNYLSDRKQRVVLPSISSAWNFIRACVPQCSILCSLFFLVYMNDIVTDIGSNIRLFADDTSLYIIVDSPLVAAETLNADLENISRWTATWLMIFNPNKM